MTPRIPGFWRAAWLCPFVLALPAPLLAQSLERELAGLAGRNAELYAQPVTRGLGFAISSGLFDGAKALSGFGFDVGFRVWASRPPEDTKTFLAVLPESLEWDHPAFGGTYHDPFRPKGNGAPVTPSAVGEGEGIVLEPNGDFRTMLIAAGESPEDYEIRFPDGLRIPAVPFGVMHASLGLGLGTEVSLRFTPRIEIHEDVGRVRATGLAVRHEITRWIDSPVDVSAVVGIQSFTAGDYLEASARQYGLIAGRTVGPLSLFTSGTFRAADIDVAFTVRNPEGNPALPGDGAEVRFSQDVERGFAVGAGAHLSLLFMNVSGQYVLDDYGVLALKIGFGVP